MAHVGATIATFLGAAHAQ